MAESIPMFASIYAFFSIFQALKIFTLLHRSKLNISAKNRFEKSALFFVKNSTSDTKNSRHLVCVLKKFSNIL